LNYAQTIWDKIGVLLGILSRGILGGHLWELDRNTLGTDKTQKAEVLHYLISEAPLSPFSTWANTPNY
jgi:hypothetical protein